MKHIFICILFALSICILDSCKWGIKKNNDVEFSKEILFEEQDVIDSARILNDEILIELDCGSIKVSEDSLYFSYRVTNSSSNKLVLYNIQYLNFELESYKLFSFPEDTIIFYPKCKSQIINDNNELPRGIDRKSVV